MGIFAVVNLHKSTLISLQSSNNTKGKWAIGTDSHLNICKNNGGVLHFKAAERQGVQLIVFLLA
jgi:hypothetical protein